MPFGQAAPFLRPPTVLLQFLPPTGILRLPWGKGRRRASRAVEWVTRERGGCLPRTFRRRLAT